MNRAHRPASLPPLPRDPGYVERKGRAAAAQILRGDPANLCPPSEFRYGGGHAIERLVAGDRLELRAQSCGTDDYPQRELRTWLTLKALNQAIMVNPRNCCQNYDVAVNASDRAIHTCLGALGPNLRNAGSSSAGHPGTPPQTAGSLFRREVYPLHQFTAYSV